MRCRTSQIRNNVRQDHSEFVREQRIAVYKSDQSIIQLNKTCNLWSVYGISIQVPWDQREQLSVLTTKYKNKHAMQTDLSP